MKKALLITIMATFGTIGAFAQNGIVSFSISTNLMYTTTGSAPYTKAPTGNPDSLGITLAVYSAPSGTTLGTDPKYGNLNVPLFTSTWSESTTLAQNVNPLPGDLPTTIMTLANTVAGSATEMELVAWSGGYSSFAAAESGDALLGWSGSALNGGAFGWSQNTGTSISPVSMVRGVDGFSGTMILEPVPEPGSIALSALGAAALLLFHRRK